MATAHADSQLTSWLTTSSAQYARVYKTTSDRTSGSTYTTWSGQSSPSYSDIQEISYSASWIYVRYAGLSSYVMGPWLNPQGGQFVFWPTNQHGLRRFPRSPVDKIGNKDTTPAGYSGVFVNGVAIFNALDGMAWNGSNMVQGPHTMLTYYWHRNAPVGESFNFDYALGHQPPSGVYHTHQNNLGLRYQLGDHVDYNSTTKAYTENTNAPAKHSPIIGWAHDGYPIYGPYGYNSASNSAGGLRRMVAGYVKRDGNLGTDNVTTNLSQIPAWYARFRQKLGAAYSTTAGTSRPAISSTYPLGTFAEDWAYLGDLGYSQGADFDLDSYNGRNCVTPEFPGSTYAYFIANDSSGNGTYPYVFGYEYYGSATGGSVGSITESVTTNFNGGAYSAIMLSQPAITNNVVTLSWTAAEGGTYRVESSGNFSAWTTNASGVATTLNRGVVSTPNTGTNQFFRVVRTGLATYDP
jgi:hypothetical protein